MIAFAIIPARYAATRFPAKLMQQLGDKTVIRHTYENTIATGLFNQVWVVTDSPIIFEEIASLGGHVKMSKGNHESGSDRIAEAVKDLDVDVVVNVQGDEPFIQTKPLEDLLKVFTEKDVQVASLMQKITERIDIDNPNIVKVVCDIHQNALYFSRSAIPYNRNTYQTIDYFRHIGVYGFRKEILLRFTNWPMSYLEQSEKLEQLRYLENGIKIRMVKTSFSGIGIDTPEDLEKAKSFLH